MFLHDLKAATGTARACATAIAPAHPAVPRPMLLLAPMEGLLDYTLRDILTRVGGIDRCVSEFIRVSGTLLPNRTFLRIVPELHNGGRTPAGVPVRAQLMGSDANCLAENAAKLAALGPAGIDLNFGCPAKIVNRHRGGAALLEDPALLHTLVSAVRRAVPAHVPVSAKMRLGFNDDALALDCARAIASGGAAELVVHARTKAQGYRPPAYWSRVNDIRESVAIPVIANGDIWTLTDAEACRQQSGCIHLMLGRGMVSDPGLALAIAAASLDATAFLDATASFDATASAAAARRNDDDGNTTLAWPDLLPLLAAYWQLLPGHVQPSSYAGRLKQWLNYLRRRYPEAETAFLQLRRHNDPDEVQRMMFGVASTARCAGHRFALPAAYARAATSAANA